MTALLKRITFLVLVVAFVTGCGSSATTVEPTLNAEQIRAYTPFEWRDLEPLKGVWEDAGNGNSYCNAQPLNEEVEPEDNQSVFYLFVGEELVIKDRGNQSVQVVIAVQHISNFLTDGAAIYGTESADWPNQEQCPNVYWTQHTTFLVNGKTLFADIVEGSVISLEEKPLFVFRNVMGQTGWMTVVKVINQGGQS